jgi:hypothetical protein
LNVEAKARRGLRRAGAVIVLLIGPACHAYDLNAVNGTLVFSSPDRPAALTQLDAGLVEIAFGQVTVGSTKTLTVSFISLGAQVTLGAVTALVPDSEFRLPFAPDTVAGDVPGQVTASFSPTSLGDKTAVLLLSYGTRTQSAIFQLTGEGVANGLTVTPNPLDFGQVEINQLQALSVTITNGRGIPAKLVLTPLQDQDAGPFGLGPPSSTSLAPNASVNLDATFSPVLPGPASASFTVSGFSTDPPIIVNLTGTGVQSWLQTTSPLNFGFVPLFQSVTRSAVVTNVGNYTTLHLVAPEPLISQPPGNGGFVLGSPQPSLPVTLAPGESASIPVSFVPESLSAYSGTLFLDSDDPGGRYPAVQLAGYGGGPRISCLPEVLFGPVPVGLQASSTALCINAGSTIPSLPELSLQIAQSDLGIDSPDFVANLILPDGGLAGTGFSVSLLSGQSAAINVSFLPKDAGVVEARLTVLSNDLNDADAGVLLVGEGIVPGPCVLDVSPTRLAFGEVPPHTSGLLQFEVDNIAQDFCVLGQIALAPPFDAAFSLPGLPNHACGGRGARRDAYRHLRGPGGPQEIGPPLDPG